ncbi:hypothetical protein [Treponema vincentii]|uniref:hypothetical protein n=1 Tax=Treponema vincentii TaxID=69710 RepID=UPI0020A31F65|nr:hypothetical protein [Treponema vincentii]
MIMQDVNYQLFSDSVEAECSFGLKAVKREAVEEVLNDLNFGIVNSSTVPKYPKCI